MTRYIYNFKQLFYVTWHENKLNTRFICNFTDFTVYAFANTQKPTDKTQLLPFIYILVPKKSVPFAQKRKMKHAPSEKKDKKIDCKPAFKLCRE